MVRIDLHSRAELKKSISISHSAFSARVVEIGKARGCGDTILAPAAAPGARRPADLAHQTTEVGR